MQNDQVQDAVAILEKEIRRLEACVSDCRKQLGACSGGCDAVEKKRMLGEIERRFATCVGAIERTTGELDSLRERCCELQRACTETAGLLHREVTGRQGSHDSPSSISPLA